MEKIKAVGGRGERQREEVGALPWPAFRNMFNCQCVFSWCLVSVVNGSCQMHVIITASIKFSNNFMLRGVKIF